MATNKEAEKWLAKKQRKAQYWQVKRFLEVLRLKYNEMDIGKATYSISVPLFGLRFRFNGIPEPIDNGWKIIYIDVDKLETVPDYFREEVMWYLVEKGYMAYIRDVEVGNNERIFRRFIIEARWGEKIIRKRIELCGKDPQNTFLRMRMEEFLTLPIQKILSHYPSFFDYLM